MNRPGLVHGSELTSQIIALAMRVHSRSVPACWRMPTSDAYAMNSSVMPCPTRARSKLPIEYDDLHLDCGYRADIIVADEVIVEIKSIDRILPFHEAQLLTYLRISRHRIGLLINFNTISLKDGLRRCVL